MLFSRAIRLRSLKEGETLAMVPYADLINHSPFSQAYIDAREGGDWLFSSGEEEVILYADRGYRRMEQVSFGNTFSSWTLLVLVNKPTPHISVHHPDLYFLWTEIERRASAPIRFCSGTKSFQLCRYYGSNCPTDGVLCEGVE